MKKEKKEEASSGKKWEREISDETPERGRLKIFFGYAEGTGKTYTMLKAACAAKRRGVDVAVGYVETHGCRKMECRGNSTWTGPLKENRSC